MRTSRLLIGVALCVSSQLAAQTSCPVIRYGASCGPLLDGKVELDAKDRIIEVKLSSTHKGVVGLLVVGSTVQRIKLNANCWLHTDATLLLPFVTDGNGSARQVARVPYAQSFASNVQHVLLVPKGTSTTLESSNALRIGPWSGVASAIEDFSTSAKLDLDRSSVIYSKGKVVLPSLGGSGVLGAFDVRFGGKDTGKKDSAGRRIYEWDTKRIVIPGSRTKTGKDISVSNGVLHFSSFHLPATARLRFFGPHAPRIEVTDDIKIDGVIDNSGFSGIKLEGASGKPPKTAQDGFAGGAGGARGGRGGDSPHKSGTKKIHGSDGAGVVGPAGHPLASTFGLCAGRGSRAHPRSGLDKDIGYSAYAKTICQAATAGGGGGGNLWPGLAGRVVDNGRGLVIYPPQPFDFGPPSVPGQALRYQTLFGLKKPSHELYVLGGAAGGGAGTHAFGAFRSTSAPVEWTPGSGGAGGGGPIHLVASGSLIVASGGGIETRGGAGQRFSFDERNFTNPAPGGAGAGGNVLIQLGKTVRLDGMIDARGGREGHLDGYGGPQSFQLRIDSLSGSGGHGFVRFETDPILKLDLVKNVAPPVARGGLAKLDPKNLMIEAELWSKWIDAGRRPLVWHHYTVNAKIDGQDVVFSDNPLIGTTASPGGVVEFQMQSAQLDANGKVIGQPTGWRIGKISGLANDPNAGNGYRYRVILRRKPSQNKRGDVELSKIRIDFDC